MRGIRRHIWIALMLFALPVAVTLVLVMRQPTVPLGECSELYRRYADSQDIRAAYIKDYRLNDTITICATILEATTDSSWSLLLHDFSITIYPEMTNLLEDGNDAIMCEQGINCEIMSDNELAVLSLRDKYICIFHNLEDLKRSGFYDAILDKIMNSLLNHKTFIKNEENT